MFRFRSLTDLLCDTGGGGFDDAASPVTNLLVSEHFPSAFELGFRTLDNIGGGIVVDIDYQQSVRSLAHRRTDPGRSMVTPLDVHPGTDSSGPHDSK